MASPAVAATTNNTLFATNQDITLPSGLAADDMLIIAWCSSEAVSAGNSYTPPTGWTLRRAHRAANAPCAIIMWRKVADSTEAAALSGSTVRLTLTGIIRSTFICDRITGAKGVLDFRTGTSTNITSNPPPLTAPWGQFDYLWLAYTFGANPAGISAYPTGYSGNLVQQGPAGAGNTQIGRVWRQLNAQSEDPPAFTIGSTPGNSVTMTIVVLPDDASTPVPAYKGRSTFVSNAAATAPGTTDTMIHPDANVVAGRYIDDGDTVLIVHESGNQFLASNFFAAQGFTEVGRYGTGTAGGASANVGIQVFACPSVIANDLRPLAEGGTFEYGDTGNHTTSAYFVWEGLAGFDAAILDEAGSTQTLGSSAAGNLDTFTTTDAAAIACIVATDRDSSATSNFSAWGAGNLVELVERGEQSFTTGSGGGIGLASGLITSSGALGTLTVTNGVAAGILVATMTVAIGLTATGGGGGDVTFATSSSFALGSSVGLATEKAFSTTGAIALGSSGSLAVQRALSTTSAIALSSSAAITKDVPFAGEGALELTGDGVLAVDRGFGTSGTLALGSSASLVVEFALAGSSVVGLGSSAVLAVDRALAGTGSLSFGSAVAVAVDRAFAGQGVLALAGAVALSSDRAFATVAALELTGIAALTVEAGTQDVLFEAAGDFALSSSVALVITAAFASAASVGLGGQAVLGVDRSLIGSGSLALGATAGFGVVLGFAGAGAINFGSVAQVSNDLAFAGEGAFAIEGLASLAIVNPAAVPPKRTTHASARQPASEAPNGGSTVSSARQGPTVSPTTRTTSAPRRAA